MSRIMRLLPILLIGLTVSVGCATTSTNAPISDLQGDTISQSSYQSIVFGKLRVGGRFQTWKGTDASFTIDKDGNRFKFRVSGKNIQTEKLAPRESPLSEKFSKLTFNELTFFGQAEPGKYHFEEISFLITNDGFGIINYKMDDIPCLISPGELVYLGVVEVENLRLLSYGDYEYRVNIKTNNSELDNSKKIFAGMYPVLYDKYKDKITIAPCSGGGTIKLKYTSVNKIEL